MAWQEHVAAVEMRALVKAVSELSAHVSQLEPKQIEMKTLTTIYQANHNGTVGPHTVTDSQNSGETYADFRARHFAHVVDEQDNGGYPPA